MDLNLAYAMKLNPCSIQVQSKFNKSSTGVDTMAGNTWNIYVDKVRWGMVRDDQS